jgi:RNA recognition motif-containing protein
MNLYVGNLSYDLSESDLNRTFSEYGTVESVRLITDRDTGRPRGFGFVEMSDKAAGREAIEGLNDKEIGGRRLVVNEARPKTGR